MAVSVDTVYQRVLALANKEQRGYITPQEYNLLANQAQMQIFESYFYTKNQRDRLEPDRNHEIDETDISELITRKLRPFSEIVSVLGGSMFPDNITVGSENLEVFQVGNIYFNNRVCAKVDVNEARHFQASTRHAYPSSNGPIFHDAITGGADIQVFADGIIAQTTGVTAEVFRVPRTVNWAYVVVNEKALYNANLAVNFELHRSEEDTLVLKILELAGIVINKIGLAQTANTAIAAKDQMQKV